MATRPPITIWIHGTLPEYIFPPLRYITIESLTNFFYCKKGLNKASSYAKKYHHYDIAKTLASSDPRHFPFDQFYIFGWSGKLGTSERLAAAQQLAQSVSQLINKYKKQYKQEPYLRIITHSHGGNVALHLADIIATDLTRVDELLLLAIPVQHETEDLAKSPLFKKIVSLHSHWDLLQVADPQGWPTWWQSIKETFKVHTQKKFNEMVQTMESNDLFSHRHFLKSRKIKQASIYYNKRGLLHIEFLLLPFIKELPHILNLINSPTKRIKLPRDDGDYMIELK